MTRILTVLAAALLLGLAPTTALATHPQPLPDDACVTGCLLDYEQCIAGTHACEVQCKTQLEERVAACLTLRGRKKVRRCLHEAKQEALLCLESCSLSTCYDEARQCVAACR